MVYLVLVNAVAHIIAAILWREYNPGLWTALILFVPLGTFALLQIARAPGVEEIHHATGLAIAIGIHAAIVIYTRDQAARITRQRVGGVTKACTNGFTFVRLPCCYVQSLLHQLDVLCWRFALRTRDMAAPGGN